MDDKKKAYLLKITQTIIKWMPAVFMLLYWVCIVAFMKGIFIPVFEDGVEFEYTWNNSQCTLMILTLVLIYFGMNMNKMLLRKR